MEDNKYKELANLNAVALSEFVDLVENSEELLPEWKLAIAQMVLNGVPQNLNEVKALIGKIKLC